MRRAALENVECKKRVREAGDDREDGKVKREKG